MIVEVLSIPDCRNRAAARAAVEHALKNLDMNAVIVEIAVLDEQDAHRRQFLGSPTVRVDGEDVDPRAGARDRYGYGCRIYPDGGQLSNVPPIRLIEDALTRARSR